MPIAKTSHSTYYITWGWHNVMHHTFKTMKQQIFLVMTYITIAGNSFLTNDTGLGIKGVLGILFFSIKSFYANQFILFLVFMLLVRSFIPLS